MSLNELTPRQVVSRNISSYLISGFFSDASRQHCKNKPSERRLKYQLKNSSQDFASRKAGKLYCRANFKKILKGPKFGPKICLD